MGKIFAIARNALTETVRQPVFVIILAVGAFMISLSPSFAMFTLMDDVKLLKDMGLATILLTGLLQAAFSAGNVISTEVEDKTILTILTKPVSKAQFILGKFAGIAVAITASTIPKCTAAMIIPWHLGQTSSSYLPCPPAADINVCQPLSPGRYLFGGSSLVIALHISHATVMLFIIAPR